ncbi:MAG: hypothetical protein BJ554DRAFT_3445, partial [Olpidium bornovanus]
VLRRERAVLGGRETLPGEGPGAARRGRRDGDRQGGRVPGGAEDIPQVHRPQRDAPAERAAVLHGARAAKICGREETTTAAGGPQDLRRNLLAHLPLDASGLVSVVLAAAE